MNGSPDPTPADELRALAAGLSGALGREARRGTRRVPAAEPVDEPVREPAPPPPQRVPRAAAPDSAPAPDAAPARSTAPRFAVATGPGDEWGNVPGAAPGAAPARPPASAAGGDARAPARSAADVRAQAAACGDLASLRARVARCEACGLARTRTQTVFSDGEGTRGVMFVGEAPGADEDIQGVPFVGRAGRLLTDIITKGMGLERREVAIANVLKCRPPENRDPTPDEKRTCTPWLDRQIELMDPKVLIPLGRHAAMHLIGVEASMGSMRGKVHEVRGRKLVATYHPAYLLRSPGQKKECWKDIQIAMAELGLTPPASRGADSGPAAGRDA